MNRWALLDPSKGLKRLLEQKRRQIGCLILFFAIIFALMADRGVFFGILNEASGWRQVSAVGVILSRSTAAGMTFIYPCMLLPLARNTLSKLRQSSLNRYIPFDSAIDFHKFAAKD